MGGPVPGDDEADLYARVAEQDRVIAEQALAIERLERELARSAEPAANDSIEALWSRIESRMGMRPSFFRLAAADPDVLAGLAGVASAAYLDAAPPPLLKEVLFTYLSRFCTARYCVARHAGFLLGLGHVAGDATVPALTPAQVAEFLAEPIPHGAALTAVLRSLEHNGPLVAWPDPFTPTGRRLRIACAVIFLQGRAARAWVVMLRRLLGPARFAQLMFLLAFIRLAHFWSEVHPELVWEDDLEILAREHAQLATLLLQSDRAPEDSEVSVRVRTETEELSDALRLMDELRQSEERWKLALEATDAGAWELNLRDHSAWRSPRYDEIFGYRSPPPHWSYDAFLEHVLTESRAAVNAAFHAALNERRDWRFECRIRRADGVLRRVRGTGRARYESSGRPVLMWGVVEDVTDERRSEEALREADRRKDEFLAVLGHELRNPLAPLSTGLELLREGGDRPELIASVRAMMQRQLAHLVRLVDDLLDVSRVSRGLVEIHAAPIDLWTVIEAAVEQVRHQLRAYRHELVVEPPDGPLPVEGDYERLTQVFVNLLGNAAKYSDPGGTVRISTETDGDWAVVRVRDQGFGIPPERLGSLFQMFSQVPEHRERTGGGGLGIGLAVSRQFVEMHGGSIEAASEGLGAGTEFCVRLALAAHDPAAPGSAGPVPAPRSAARRVLVVDDNADAAESLRMALELDGHVARAVYSGQAALAAMESFAPEIVLLDIGLPGISGYDVARRMRERAGDRPLKLFAVTGWGQEEDKRRAAGAGFDEHLTKPVDRARLASLLAHA